MAASLPSREATCSSSNWTVGSSPRTSSPTLALAMALRIAGVGWVIVSLRRSMGCMGSFGWLGFIGWWGCEVLLGLRMRLGVVFVDRVAGSGA